VLAKLRSALTDWRRRRYLKKHPEPHRDRLAPRRRGIADADDRTGKPPRVYGGPL
jgi:hypothetical protein